MTNKKAFIPASSSSSSSSLILWLIIDEFLFFKFVIFQKFIIFFEYFNFDLILLRIIKIKNMQ